MVNLNEIYKSWLISFNPTQEQKEISQERLNECMKCDNLKYLNLFDTHVCKLCNCPINKLIFSPNKKNCKSNLWKK